MKNNEYSIPHHGLSTEEKRIADEQLKTERFKRLNEMSESNKIYAELLRLKYEIVDYLEQDIYDKKFSFGVFLKKYIQIFGLKRKELAENLSVHETKFSRLINDKEDPGLNIIYRLESHSNGVLRANLLWKLLVRKLENEISRNTKDRKLQSKLVRNKFKFEQGNKTSTHG